MSDGSRPMVYLGDHVALTRTVFDHKIFVDTRDLSLTPHILLDGYWEMWVTEVFMRLIEPGMTVIDIGANIGYYSLLAGSGVGPSGKVISFEANPDVFSMLGNSMEINGFLDRAELVNLGVMDAPGELTFFRLRAHHGSSGFFVDPAEFRDTADELAVSCVSLDDYFEERDDRIDLIKIDAEGAEPAIIEGAKELLRRNPAVKVLIEYTPANRSAFVTLASLGFVFSSVRHDATLEPVAMDDLGSDEALSMVFCSRA